jgi:hypothetical protein
MQLSAHSANKETVTLVRGTKFDGKIRQFQCRKSLNWFKPENLRVQEQIFPSHIGRHCCIEEQFWHCLILNEANGMANQSSLACSFLNCPRSFAPQYR